MRETLWMAVRYRLLVLVLMGVVVASFAIALRGSVHVGLPTPDPIDGYAGSVTAWTVGYAGLAGWVANRTDLDCPSIVVWVPSYESDGLTWLGPVGVTYGFVAIGPLRAHQRVIWTGYRRDVRNRLAPLNADPLPDPTFDCYR